MDKMTPERAREYLTKEPHYMSVAVNQVAAEGFLEGFKAGMTADVVKEIIHLVMKLSDRSSLVDDALLKYQAELSRSEKQI